MAYLDQFALDALPDDAKHLLWLCYSLVTVSFPSRCGASPACPTAARRLRRVVARDLTRRSERPSRQAAGRRCGSTSPPFITKRTCSVTRDVGRAGRRARR